jgi:hypothetical protein
MATAGALVGASIAGLAYKLSGQNYTLTFAMATIPACLALVLTISVRMPPPPPSIYPCKETQHVQRHASVAAVRQHLGRPLASSAVHQQSTPAMHLCSGADYISPCWCARQAFGDSAKSAAATKAAAAGEQGLLLSASLPCSLHRNGVMPEASALACMRARRFPALPAERRAFSVPCARAEKARASPAAADEVQLSLGQKARALLGALQPAYWQALLVVSLLYFARFDASFITLRARTVHPHPPLPFTLLFTPS